MSHPFRPCIILLLLVNGFQVTSLLIKCSRAVSFLSLLLGSLCLFPKRITTASGATPTHASIISAHTIWTEPLHGWRISIRIFCFFEMMTGGTNPISHFFEMSISPVCISILDTLRKCNFVKEIHEEAQNAGQRPRMNIHGQSWWSHNYWREYKKTHHGIFKILDLLKRVRLDAEEEILPWLERSLWLFAPVLLLLVHHYTPEVMWYFTTWTRIWEHGIS